MVKRVTRMTQYEIHTVLFHILKEVDRIFQKHDIPYFLAFGTLLGCVRDGGFIPWDDDIDIAVMPEYWDRMNEVLAEEMNEGSFFVINKLTRPNYPTWPFLTRVGVHEATRIREYYKEETDRKSDICIDIFSLVKAPQNKIKLEMWDWELGVIDGVINMKTCREGMYPKPSLLSKVLCKTIYKDSSLYKLNFIREKIQCRYHSSNESHIMVPFGPYGRYPVEKSKYKIEWVKDLERKDFKVFNDEGEAAESSQFPIPSAYKKILETTYGNWRVRPKGERPKRLFYWKEKGEKNYEGVGR